MRVWISGGGGFVGSNIVQAALEGGHEVLTTANTWTAPPGAPYAVASVDMCDEAAVRASLDAFEPDLVIHCAIMNDWDQMHADRHGAWAAYVEATRNYGDAANAADIPWCLVSTDWVFDGTQSMATEYTPPNPINLYGFLKAASEIVAVERGGSFARVMGVNGTHWARPTTPRLQDPGYGYFVASIVDALEQGRVQLGDLDALRGRQNAVFT